MDFIGSNFEFARLTNPAVQRRFDVISVPGGSQYSTAYQNAAPKRVCRAGFNPLHPLYLQ
jgi:hypothetical protein